MSTRNCRLLSLSVMMRRPVIVAHACTVVDVRCVRFPADGRRRAEYTFAPGLHSGNGTSRG
jgi:hypothetical protein